jgi:hypothetical protein
LDKTINRWQHRKTFDSSNRIDPMTQPWYPECPTAAMTPCRSWTMAVNVALVPMNKRIKGKQSIGGSTATTLNTF